MAGADGIWNPADYITNRYEIDNPYYEGKSLFGNIARKNFNKIPQEALDYISGEVQKRIDSGYKLNKWFLRELENKVKANWPNDVPQNWDISSAISTDKGMAKAINKQSNLGQNKRVGNTQAQVAQASPGDTVLAGGKNVALTQQDIDKAQSNVGNTQQASDAFSDRHQAEKQESLDKASQMTEHEQKVRDNAQKLDTTSKPVEMPKTTVDNTQRVQSAKTDASNAYSQTVADIAANEPVVKTEPENETPAEIDSLYGLNAEELYEKYKDRLPSANYAQWYPWRKYYDAYRNAKDSRDTRLNLTKKSNGKQNWSKQIAKDEQIMKECTDGFRQYIIDNIIKGGK